MVITGAELRQERVQAGILATDIAACWDRDEAIITHLEQAAEVSPERARAFRRALRALVKQRRAARNDLLRELAAR